MFAFLFVFVLLLLFWRIKMNITIMQPTEEPMQLTHVNLNR